MTTPAGGRVKSTSKVSVQKVGRDTYRVNAKSGRSAITGQFVTKRAADKAAKSATKGNASKSA